MKHLKQFFILLPAVILLLLPRTALAVTDGTPDFTDLENYIGGFLGSVTTLATVAVFAMLLFGGFKYLMAGGDPKAIEGARNTITYAIVGVVVMIFAWIILRFIQEFTGVNVTVFSIKIP